MNFNKVSPQETYQTEDSESSSECSSELTGKSINSIKCCLVLVVSILIFLSVIVLTGTWLASFSPTIVELSSIIRNEEFSKIKSYGDQVLKDVAIINDAAKQRMITDGFIFGDYSYLERSTYASYKTSQKLLPGILVSSYSGNTDGLCLGSIMWGNDLVTINETKDEQMLYICNNVTLNDYCVRNSVPDIITPPFDLSYLIQLCEENAGDQVFSLSYADSTMPQYVFVSVISCVVDKRYPLESGHNFHYFVAHDLTTATISDFLKELISSIVGSFVFVIETETGFLIAVGNDAKISEWSSDGSLDRKTPLTVQDHDINSLSTELLNSYGKWTNLKCNQVKLMSTRAEFVTIYRMCTTSKIDWILVLSVPQWNFFGSTIIAILCSLVGSGLVIVIGILSGFIFSLRVVKPLNNLIRQFENVSNES